jgi:hypothetical protein
MLNNTKVTYDITCENNLTHIEKQLFEKSIYWIKDTNTTNNQIRYLKKYNELSMIEINCEQNNYSVLVPLTDINFRLYFNENSIVKMVDYINNYI